MRAHASSREPCAPEVPRIHPDALAVFNFCTVLVLLPLEAISGYLFALSGALIPDDLKSGDKPPDFLKVITKPFTKIVMSVDKKRVAPIRTRN